jgi:hypothetical protein
MAVVVSCAGDNGLAKRLYDHMASEFSPNFVSLNGDEITVQAKELGIKNDALHRSISKFVGSNSDLVGYSITEFGDIFTLGIQQSLDKVVLACEMCGYVARHESDLGLHKRTHGRVFIP